MPHPRSKYGNYGKALNKAATRARKLIGKPAPEFGWYAILKPKHQKFVDEYIIDLNAWGAAKRAGYTGMNAYPLLNRDDIRGAIKERTELMAAERRLQAPSLIYNDLHEIRAADPRELVEIWKVPCRYCWGTNGQYQFTKTEMDTLVTAYELGSDGKPYKALWPRNDAAESAYIRGKYGMGFDPKGGDGYTPKRDPNPECSECAGDGIRLEIVHDTRKLSVGARALYRGARWSKDGKFEILMADQQHARDMLAKHHGIATERKHIMVHKLTPEGLNEDEIIAAIEEMQNKVREIDGEYSVVEDEEQPRQITRPGSVNKIRRPE